MTGAEDGQDPRGGEADSAAVDRAFADLVAGYHLTADRPDPLAGQPAARTEDPPPTTSWADEHPLFRYDEPDPVPEPAEIEEHYEAPAPGPLPKPAWPALLGWLGMGYAVLVLLAVVVGVHLPGWAAWLGIIGFVGGFAVLVARLPRDRSPDDGDGAVL